LIARIVVVIVVAAAAWVGWGWLLPGDEAEIRAVLTRIADAVDGGDGEGAGSGGLDGIARIAALQNEFAPDATADAGPPLEQLRGRQAIVATAARVRAAARHLELRFPDVAITLADDRGSATAVVTAEARFDEPGGGRALEARELELAFSRYEGRWVIGAIRLIEPLNRLQ
jgi:hypothetical protein